MNDTVNLVAVETPNGTMYVERSQTRQPKGLGFWALINTAVEFVVGEYDKGDEAKQQNELNIIEQQNVSQDIERGEYTLSQLEIDILNANSLYNNNKTTAIWIGGGVAAIVIAAIVKNHKK